MNRFQRLHSTQFVIYWPSMLWSTASYPASDKQVKLNKFLKKNCALFQINMICTCIRKKSWHSISGRLTIWQTQRADPRSARKLQVYKTHTSFLPVVKPRFECGSDTVQWKFMLLHVVQKDVKKKIKCEIIWLDFVIGIYFLWKRKRLGPTLLQCSNENH